MTIQEYNKFGRSGRKDWFYVLCEDPKRQALFMEFGGQIHWKDAEKWNTED